MNVDQALRAIDETRHKDFKDEVSIRQVSDEFGLVAEVTGEHAAVLVFLVDKRVDPIVVHTYRIGNARQLLFHQILQPKGEARTVVLGKGALAAVLVSALALDYAVIRVVVA